MGANIFTSTNANLPSGFDRADGGVTTDFGTFTPDILVGMNNSNNSFIIFEEASDSPIVEFGEQCTITHKFYVDYLSGRVIQASYPRGRILYDNAVGPFGPNVSRVLSTTLQPISKTNTLVCLLTVISEAQSFANPPDEFDVEVVELNPAAEKHPRYSGLTYYQKDIIRGTVVADYLDVKQQYQSVINTFSGSSNQWQNQQGQGLELLYKKQKGEDSFYLSGFKIIYSKYYWSPIDINPGGYIENPFNYIPAQFWSNPSAGVNNIFERVALANANLYPNQNSALTPPYGLSWLRQTDTLHRQRTWYKVTSTWIGAPLATWDAEWYSPTLQPLQTLPTQGYVFNA